MRCPFCAHEDSQVKDSRPTEDAAAIRRRRQCEGCGARFTTFERVQLRDLTVVKADGKRETFDREKLARSIILACRKRPVDAGKVDQLVSGIQRQLETLGEGDVTTSQIGKLAMEGLKRLDSVAYIRFASVYQEFTDPRDFEEFAGSVMAARDPDHPVLPMEE
jgi:transcriptional repressor NrdR